MTLSAPRNYPAITAVASVLLGFTATDLPAQEPVAWGPDLEFHTFSIIEHGTKEQIAQIQQIIETKEDKLLEINIAVSDESLVLSSSIPTFYETLNTFS